MGNTANNNWPYPESTDLVKDGATAIENLADAIDTTLGVFVPSNPGLTLINTTSFSAVATQSVNDVFSATYDSYLINIAGESFTGSDNFRMRMRVAGADSTASSYFSVVRAFSNQQVQLFLGANGDDKFFIGQFDSNNPANINMIINYPFAAKKTIYSGTGNGMQGGFQMAQHQAGMFNATTSFTGFTLIPAAGNMTGKVTVYGLAQ